MCTTTGSFDILLRPLFISEGLITGSLNEMGAAECGRPKNRGSISGTARDFCRLQASMLALGPTQFPVVG
jgi:hypothetical protein